MNDELDMIKLNIYEAFDNGEITYGEKEYLLEQVDYMYEDAYADNMNKIISKIDDLNRAIIKEKDPEKRKALKKELHNTRYTVKLDEKGKPVKDANGNPIRNVDRLKLITNQMIAHGYDPRWAEKHGTNAENKKHRRKSEKIDKRINILNDTLKGEKDPEKRKALEKEIKQLKNDKKDHRSTEGRGIVGSHTAYGIDNALLNNDIVADYSTRGRSGNPNKNFTVIGKKNTDSDNEKIHVTVDEQNAYNTFKYRRKAKKAEQDAYDIENHTPNRVINDPTYKERLKPKLERKKKEEEIRQYKNDEKLQKIDRNLNRAAAVAAVGGAIYLGSKYLKHKNSKKVLIDKRKKLIEKMRNCVNNEKREKIKREIQEIDKKLSNINEAVFDMLFEAVHDIS